MTYSPASLTTHAVRFCHDCQKAYADAGETFGTMTCPSCQKNNTSPWASKAVLPFPASPLPPVQQFLFDPTEPPPKPDRWVIEWRWDKRRLLHAAKTKPWFARSNDFPALESLDTSWQVHGRGVYAVEGWAVEKAARNAARRLRSCYPGKSWRVRPCHWVGQPD